MVGSALHRRALLKGMAASAFLPTASRGETFIELSWADLVPENETYIPNVLRGFIDHDQAPMNTLQPESSGVRSEWDDQNVRLPGFVVPIDQRREGTTAFILVPYAGACVHVPPPPANQLVFVTTDTPYPSKGLYEAVIVTGKFNVSTLNTHLAEVGYALAANEIEPFKL